jgi:hypothetical protein
MTINPERVPLLANPFRVPSWFLIHNPGLSLRSNPGLKLANAFGVIIPGILSFTTPSDEQ